MLTMLIGTDWTQNRAVVLQKLTSDIHNQLPNRILLVPELISHDTERRLCQTAGNTCSRFAEVLSFTRLTKRICEWAGCGLESCLDNGGRLVAMASASRQLHGQLKAYASVESQPEFLASIVDAVDEFKRCCISAEDIFAASKNTTGAFAQKLEELALLYQAYDGICARGKKDPRDQIIWGLEQLENCDFAQKHTFYIDGFPDFTQQNLAVISYLIANSPEVTISFNCDRPGSTAPAFEKAGSSAKQLLRIAEQLGVKTNIEVIPFRNSSLHGVCAHLFQGNPAPDDTYADRLRVVQADSIYDECSLAAEQILQLVHQGARYRDISVVCPNPEMYKSLLTMQLDLCNIPSYIAGTEDILEKTVISTVLTALDAVLNNFETKDLLRFLKSPLTPLSLELCDAIENYVHVWNIQGKKWFCDWTGHPDGLVDVWSEEHTQLLSQINIGRKQIIAPLKRLADCFHASVKLSDQVQAVYEFLKDIHLRERLEELASEFYLAGEYRDAQILNQLWDILLLALEQLDGVLGNTAWDNDTFTKLLRVLLSQYDVGTIPPVLDAVTIGPVNAMRCQEVSHLIVIGATEGSFPSYGSTSGVLSDYERTALRQLGIPLTGGAAEGLQIEMSEIYGVFCGAKETVYVSCLADQASFVVRRLLNMAGEEYKPIHALSAIGVNKLEAAAYLCRMNAEQAAHQLGIQDQYIQTYQKKVHALGNVKRASIVNLYGSTLNLSASQVDTQADCRLAYFLKYGLRAKEQKIATVDPAEFGTFVHAVLEETAREVNSLGGFKAVTLEQTAEIAQKHA